MQAPQQIQAVDLQVNTIYSHFKSLIGLTISIAQSHQNDSIISFKTFQEIIALKEIKQIISPQLKILDLKQLMRLKSRIRLLLDFNFSWTIRNQQKATLHKLLLSSSLNDLQPAFRILIKNLMLYIKQLLCDPVKTTIFNYVDEQALKLLELKQLIKQQNENQLICKSRNSKSCFKLASKASQLFIKQNKQANQRIAQKKNNYFVRLARCVKLQTEPSNNLMQRSNSSCILIQTYSSKKSIKYLKKSCNEKSVLTVSKIDIKLDDNHCCKAKKNIKKLKILKFF